MAAMCCCRSPREFVPVVDVKAGRLVIAVPEDSEPENVAKGFVE